MDLVSFRAANLAAGDKGRFLQDFIDPRTKQKMAYFILDNACYTAIGDSKYDPIFKLCGAGFKQMDIMRNYPDDQLSESDKGALMLHDSTSTYIKPSLGSNLKISPKTFYKVGINVAQSLKAKFPVPSNISPIVANIQAENVSVKRNGKFESCGMHTVHRLYMATAFTMLRKFHQANARDGVVALIVDQQGRIISWGQKNPAVCCWHGETSAIMALGGKIPPGSRVYSTLKPCNMCSGLIYTASGGDAKVFWGQDDPGSMAQGTILDTAHLGRVLDGNKSHNGARGILLDANNGGRSPMSNQLQSDFNAQKFTGKRSTIDYIVTDEASQLIQGAEQVLKHKYEKYAQGPENFNENTAFVVRYLTDFLKQLGLPPDNLGT